MFVVSAGDEGLEKEDDDYHSLKATLFFEKNACRG